MNFRVYLQRRRRDLKDEFRQIRIARKIADMAFDKCGIDGDRIARLVGCGEAHLVEHPFHHRLKPARPDILDRAVDFGGDIGERRNPFIGEVERHPFGAEQGDILLDEA